MGLIGLSAVTGMLEIDATTISLCRMVGEGLAPRTATLMLLLGLATNGLVKMVVIGTIGGVRLMLIVGLSFTAVALAAGAVVLVAL